MIPDPTQSLLSYPTSLFFISISSWAWGKLMSLEEIVNT